MTVAVGFRCKNGVVLAADTEISRDLSSGKTYQTKLFVINYDLDAYIAYSGVVDFATELAQDLQVTTKGKPANEALVLIKTHYKEFWNEHYTRPPRAEKSFADLLVTLRESSKTSLYLARGRHFTRVDEYKTLGVGDDQSEAIFNPIFKKWLTVNECMYVAIYGLRKAKGFVQYCGGETEVRVIKDHSDNEIILPDLDMRNVKDVEGDFEFLDSQLHSIVPAFADFGEINDTEFRQLLNAFAKSLKGYRTKKFRRHERERERRWEEMRKWEKRTIGRD